MLRKTTAGPAELVCVVCQQRVTREDVGMYAPPEGNVSVSIGVVHRGCVEREIATLLWPHAKARPLMKIIADVLQQLGLDASAVTEVHDGSRISEHTTADPAG